ncbi:hypothetical protein [Calothrix sp. PCC 7507]|uniref:hypothetical protein n=1 Tax=Calothrix sp. PCC 7507 TaxID=99598 RepID=UPI00029F039D|nr:hypothetical protein [Calothrix sp. PCC 7507]AFY32279.1 hypothetical protein Cal7507_1824 [Calothrix sp. PCC 7507]
MNLLPVWLLGRFVVCIVAVYATNIVTGLSFGGDRRMKHRLAAGIEVLGDGAK